MENHKKSHLFLLHQQYDSLTTSEKKIADYILQNTSEIMETTIEKLSENCKTSIATISRFSKKLGFENFYHLKISIAKEFINPGQNYFIPEKSSFKNIYSRVINTNIEVLTKNISTIDQEPLKKVVEKLLNANHIYLFAMGASIPLVFEAFNKFSRLNLKCSFVLDFHTQILQASTLSKNDVAVIFSHSGVNKDILNLVEIIGKTNGTSIGITNYAKTPFHNSVDLCLYFSDKTISNELLGFSSKVPLMLIIETIYQIILSENNEKNKELLKNYNSVIKKISI